MKQQFKMKVKTVTSFFLIFFIFNIGIDLHMTRLNSINYMKQPSKINHQISWKYF